MEEEPAERVTTHHRSVGKEGLRWQGWRDEGRGLDTVALAVREHNDHALTSI